MLLHSLTVENFRPFETASVHLPSCGLVLIAGANNAGKSALLSAFDVVAAIHMDVQAWRRAGSLGSARVTATFELTDEERSAWFAASPRKAEFMEIGVAKHMQLIFEEMTEGPPEFMQVMGEWPDRGFQVFGTMGMSETGQGYVVKVIRALLAGHDDVGPLRLIDQQSGGWSGSMSLESALGSLYVPSLAYVRRLRYDWAARYYHFHALRPGTQRSTQLEAARTLEPTGQNLAAVLLDLLTNRPEILRELRRLIAEIVPDIGELRIRTTESEMEVVFSANGVELNLKDLGTGVEQLLMTLVVGLTENPPFTLVIEEPETNLHHAAQRALLGLLKEWAIDRQILAATHSPVLLDWSPAGERLWHVTRAEGASMVAPVRDDPAALLSSLGVRLSDVLSATRVLVLEGPSDEDILGVWFPEVLRSPTVAVLRGRGGDNARHTEQLAEWLAGVDRIGLRRVLYLRDRDELSPSALKTLEGSGSVAVLQRRELENYLLDAAAIAQVLRPLVEAGTAAPTVSDISAAFTEAADVLRRKIIINRVCRQIRPARPLMEHTLRQRLASDGADQEAVTAAVSQRLMGEGDLRTQIEAAWQEAEADLAGRSGDDLLAVAPGEEILRAVFMRFAGRGYSKRDDGVAIAKAMPEPPEEIRGLLAVFMRDEPEVSTAL